MSDAYILEIKHLQKSFGRHDVLKDISFTLEYGKIMGLLGRNGSGKTTMIKCILGLLNCSGEIIYEGKQIDHKDIHVMNSIGALVDTAFFEDMTAYENLKILMLSTPNRDNRHIRKDIGELLDFVGLSEQSKVKVKEFSFGMKQRLALAQTLIMEPRLLILDEPFVGLDPPGIVLVREKLKDLCRRRKTSIIFSSHQLAEVAELSESLVVIESGYVKFSGTYDDLANQNKKYRIVLGKAMEPSHLVALSRMGVELQNTGQGSGRQNELVLINGNKQLNPVLYYLYSSNYEILDIICEDKVLEGFFA